MQPAVENDVFTGPTSKVGPFCIYGTLNFEPAAGPRRSLKIIAAAFNRFGEQLGWSKVQANGNFELAVKTQVPIPVELVVAATETLVDVRRVAAITRQFGAADWKGGRIEVEIDVSADTLIDWYPAEIKVWGGVYKPVVPFPGDPATALAVPCAKVEIFDVDRTGLLTSKLAEILDKFKDRPVVHLDELLTGKPTLKPSGNVVTADRPNYPRLELYRGPRPSLKPPDVPGPRKPATGAIDVSLMSGSVFIWGLNQIPYLISRKTLLYTAYTDVNGEFTCSFPWYPIHGRGKYARYDKRPDIVVRVSQMVNGVEKVLYIDPLNNVRWDQTNCEITILVDDAEIVPVEGSTEPRPQGMQAFFTRVGNDEVVNIDPATGLYTDASVKNMPYGGVLFLHGQFGDTFSKSQEYYYRISYAKAGGEYVNFAAPLADLRVAKNSNKIENFTLGPYIVDGEPALYKVRNLEGYFWFSPDLIGMWNSQAIEFDAGLYAMRLEVFDANGKPVTVQNVLPPLKLAIDNSGISVDFKVPAVTTPCGVIPATAVPPLNIQPSITQNYGHIYQWGIGYAKGIGNAVTMLESGIFVDGVAPVLLPFDAAPTMLAGVNQTCSFALEMWAWAHVRNGYTPYLYYSQTLKSIVIDASTAVRPIAP